MKAMRILIVALILATLPCAIAMAANSTSSVNEYPVDPRFQGEVAIFEVEMMASSNSGAFSATGHTVEFSGWVTHVIVDPAPYSRLDGTAVGFAAYSPTNRWDVEIRDGTGTDILDGALLNLPQARASRPVCVNGVSGGVFSSGSHTVVVAGNAQDRARFCMWLYVSATPPGQLLPRTRAVTLLDTSTTIAGSGAYTTDAWEAATDQGFYSVLVDTDAANASATLDITYQMSADGTVWTTPDTAVAVAEDLTNASGGASDGVEAASFEPVLAPFYRLILTESGGQAYTGTVSLIRR
jgi:hypothetical protein